MINNVSRIEKTILGTILITAEYGNEVIKVEPKYFINPFHKRVAKKINESIDDNTISILYYYLEDKCVGTNFEQMFIDLISVVPVVKVKELYRLLIINWFERKSK